MRWPTDYVRYRTWLAVACAGLVVGSAQAAVSYNDPADATAALVTARQQAAAARARGERLEADAARASEAADRTANQEAAIAARIQQSEAEIAGQLADIRLIGRQRAVLAARLAERQRPLVRLTAALQRLSRRPLTLSLLRPGSVRDAMYVRALFATLLPQVEQRTAGLRAELARSRALQLRALAAARSLRAGEAQLTQRRQDLAALETRQRLASRAAGGVADREADRALALAEQARDLGGLVQDLAKQGSLRQQLESLPGPLLRPLRPEQSVVVGNEAPAPNVAAGLHGYMLPVDGRLVAAAGDSPLGGVKTRGIVLVPRPGAQAVAPAAGRVAYAGPYRGYGNIVIIDHGGDWTTLITGLARLDVRVGDRLVAGGPIGAAGPVHPQLMLELRHGTQAVNPLDLIGR